MSEPRVEMQGQAEDWYLRMQRPDCSDADRAACLRWREMDPAHEAAFREVAQLWRQSEALRGHTELEALLQQDEAQERRVAHHNKWRWQVAAACAVVALALAWRLPQRPATDAVQAHYQTAVGEQRSITLTDGSTLVLDTDTAVRTVFSESLRLVQLETGQVSFTVAHDAQRPFQVQAAGGTVTAVGTHFLVRTASAAGGVVVTLIEGRVRVEAPKTVERRPAPATLSPGQQLRYDQEGQWAMVQVDPQLADGWTRGSVHADNWRLVDLLDEMNRYASVQVQLADPSLDNLRVSGVFRTGDPQSLAKVLERSWPVQAKQDEEGRVLLVRRR